MTNTDDIMTAASKSMDLAVRYGVDETNPLWTSPANHTNVDYSEHPVPLSDPRLVRIVRLRLLTDRGCPFYDISYCYGELNDGRFVQVQHPGSLSKRNLKGDIIAWAKREKVFAKRLGLLDSDNWSILKG